MSDHDRGAYTPPTDAPLSFDARQPVRGARPFPFTLVTSGLVLVALVGAIVVFYRSGVRQADQPPQAVGQPVAVKTAAPPEAQPQDPAAGLQIYNAESGQGAAGAAQPQFTAPPEQPQARPAPSVTPPPASAPVQSAELRPALPAAAEAPSAPAAAAPAPARTVQAPPRAPIAAGPRPVAAEPAHKAQKAPPTIDKLVADAEKPAAPAKAGAAAVQIGAYSSQALADKGWADAVALGARGKGKSVEKIQKDGHTLFRTAVTGFANRADAAAFCGKLKAAGKACFVR